MKALTDKDAGKTSLPILVALLLAPCLILYAPSLSYFFAQDDFYFLSRASDHGFGDLVTMFKPFGPFYRPLTTSVYFSFMLRLFGLRPAAYHVVSLSLFCVNVFLVYLVGTAVFGRRVQGVITAFFYLTRGMHFEEVSWISGIQDIMMTFFVLTSMFLYLKSSQGNRRLLFFSAGTFILALLSKETAIIYPFVLLAYEVVLNGENRRRERFAVVSLFFLMAAMFLLVHFLYIEPMPAEGRYAIGFGLFWVSNLVNYLMTCINVLFLPFILFPHFYTVSLQVFSFVLALFLLTFLLGNRKHKRSETATVFGMDKGTMQGHMRLIGFGSAFFFFGALPALPFKGRFEPYYMSLASVGISMALAAAISSLANRRLRAAILVGTCVLSLMINVQLRTKRLSHVGKFSPVARSVIHELRPLLETAPPDSTLYISGADGYLWQGLAWGSGIKVFFPAVESVVFDIVSPGYRLDGSEIVFHHTHLPDTENGRH